MCSGYNARTPPPPLSPEATSQSQGPLLHPPALPVNVGGCARLGGAAGGPQNGGWQEVLGGAWDEEGLGWGIL